MRGLFVVLGFLSGCYAGTTPLTKIDSAPAIVGKEHIEEKPKEEFRVLRREGRPIHVEVEDGYRILYVGDEDSPGYCLTAFRDNVFYGTYCAQGLDNRLDVYQYGEFIDGKLNLVTALRSGNPDAKYWEDKVLFFDMIRAHFLEVNMNDDVYKTATNRVGRNITNP